jgi:hypothetical protein
MITGPIGACRFHLGLARAVGITATWLASLALIAAVPAQAAGSAALGWPESRQPILDGSEVTLGEFFGNGPGKIPCEAWTPATVVYAGTPAERVTAQEPSAWYECGASSVSDGFTAVSLNSNEVVATAEPAITLDEPDGCTYALAREAGTNLYDPALALYETSGTATLAAGAACASTLTVTGSVGIYGPQAGGFGAVPWISITEGEREVLERQSAESEARIAAAKLQGERESHERGEREARERTEREARESVEKGRLERQSVLAYLSRAFPAEEAAKVPELLRRGGWSFVFTAPRAGKLLVDWDGISKDGRLVGDVKGALVASGTTYFGSSGTRRVTIRLTHEGRRLLEHHRGGRLTVRAVFTAVGRSAITSTDILKLEP